MRAFFALLTTAAFMTAGSLMAAEPTTSPLANHLSVGTRMIYVKLLDDNKHDIGHISKEDVDQDYAPTRLFADYFFTDNLGLELTWDKLSATAFNTENGHKQDSDGTVEISGPILTAVGRLPMDNGWTPYGGLGFAFMNGSFDDDTWWARGYSSKADWISLGRSTHARNGKRRDMVVDDAVGFVVTGGADYSVADHWSAGVYARWMHIEPDARVVGTQGHTVVEDFGGAYHLDNLALGLSVKYDF